MLVGLTNAGHHIVVTLGAEGAPVEFDIDEPELADSALALSVSAHSLISAWLTFICVGGLPIAVYIATQQAAFVCKVGLMFHVHMKHFATHSYRTMVRLYSGGHSQKQEKTGGCK